MSLHIASPKSAQVSINNLQRVMPMSGTRPLINHNDGMYLKQITSNRIGESNMLTTTEKTYTADQMAHKLGISTSYVYAKLSKLQAQPVRKEGKQAFYSANLLADLGQRQRRQRRAIPENSQGIIKQFQEKSKEHLGIDAKSSEQPAENISILDRMQNLEKKMERMEVIEKSLEEIKRILGTL